MKESDAFRASKINILFVVWLIIVFFFDVVAFLQTGSELGGGVSFGPTDSS